MNGSEDNQAVVADMILDLALPIIMENNCGASYTTWPDNIPMSNSTYAYVQSQILSGWTIGLFRDSNARAFDLLCAIAKQDTNWKDKVNDLTIQIFQDIDSSVSKNLQALHRIKYQTTFSLMARTNSYQGVLNLLTSEEGQKAQRDFARERLLNELKTLQNERYDIQNPAIIIYLLDILDEYKNKIIVDMNSVRKKASDICKNEDKKMIEQLDEFVEYWYSRTNKSDKDRRSNTYAYIVEMEKQGKLAFANLIDIPEGADQGGQLLWPTPGCMTITSKYGWRGAIAGTTHTGANFHTGVDLSGAGALGKEIYAAHEGVISTQTTSGGYGVLTKVTNGNMTTYYAHQCRRAPGIEDGVTVKKGQLIGFVGSTGNSSGPHLHFEVRINGQHTDPLPYIRK